MPPLRLSILLAALVCVALMATACGGSEPTAPPTQTQEAKPPATPAPGQEDPAKGKEGKDAGEDVGDKQKEECIKNAKKDLGSQKEAEEFCAGFY